MPRRIIITENQLRRLIEDASPDNIDFEAKQINESQFLLTVIINDNPIPNSEIEFKIEPREVNGKALYQFHLFLSGPRQRSGLGTAIIKKFVELYGNAYCGYGRMLNPNGITGIFKNLSLSSNINVEKVIVNGKPIGLLATVKNS